MLQSLLREWRPVSAARRVAAARSALLTPALLAIAAAWLDHRSPTSDAIWVAIGVLCIALGVGAVVALRGAPRTALVFARCVRLLECVLLVGLAVALQASVVALAVAGAVMAGLALGFVWLHAPASHADDRSNDESKNESTYQLKNQLKDQSNNAANSGANRNASARSPTQPLTMQMTISPPTRGVETAAFSRRPNLGPQLPEFDDSVLASAASALARDSLTAPERAHDRAGRLLLELDAALRAGPLALVNWLGAFAFVNEPEHVNYEPAQLAAQFEAAGFAPAGNAAPPANDSEAMRLWLIGTAIAQWRASRRLPAAFGRTVLQFVARNGSISRK